MTKIALPRGRVAYEAFTASSNLHPPAWDDLTDGDRERWADIEGAVLLACRPNPPRGEVAALYDAAYRKTWAEKADHATAHAAGLAAIFSEDAP